MLLAYYYLMFFERGDPMVGFRTDWCHIEKIDQFRLLLFPQPQGYKITYLNKKVFVRTRFA